MSAQDEKTSDAKNHGGENASGNGKRKRILLTIAGVFVLAGLAWFLLWLFVLSQREVTDDAYVKGNQVTVSSQIPGTVVAVMADDTDLVHAGQTLVKLDRTDTDVNLAKARSALAETVRRVRQAFANAAKADAAVDARKVELSLARADLKRREPLLKQQAVSPEEMSHLRDRVRTAQSALEVAQRNATAAHAAIDGTDIEHNPAVMQARAAFRSAWLAVHRTAIVAPVDGYVAQRSVQVGQQVQPGAPLMQVIPLNNLWVEANFKEVQLAHIRIGQPVKIEPDIYDGLVFHGKVVGLGAGTGSAFALLPPQNASGNWIKVVQRVPVRISIDPKDLRKHPLRIGLSADVNVDTHNRDGRVLAQKPVTQAVSKTGVYDRDLAEAEREADAIIQANLGRK
ncbi:multidrug efflux MFS transporter periplasmic adaptor subunit EmrA [Oleiagrimonas citrea]|uniref:HlyD family efflux transporter periplasmic adaptor subunit n=1 Tax=Oleiagrimonas citrea TaxID=1665687 RepID=A0A846ZEA9_9GAMM|nr:efflux RND transporter periplasmic adaptor subunit [Oleiagrimonas citrea]NKZ37534.1 HlyD family efflux transporter periplasmic adaptor subunit [Oleiagrimonas citrea]